MKALPIALAVAVMSAGIQHAAAEEVRKIAPADAQGEDRKSVV